MKKVVIAIVSIILLCGICGVVWYYLPVNRANRAFEQGDYKLVLELYPKLNDKDADEIKNKLIDIADEKYQEYYNTDNGYGSLIKYIELLNENGFKKEDRLEGIASDTILIRESRDEYNEAKKLMDEGHYIAAISHFDKVIDKDKKYKRKAESNSEKSKELYIADVISLMEDNINNKDYEKALEVANAALSHFPDDEELNEKYNEILLFLAPKDSIKGRWTCDYNAGSLIAWYIDAGDKEVNFPLKMNAEITDDKIILNLDRASIDEGIDKLTEENMDIIYNIIEQNGIDRVEADAMVGFLYGGSYSKMLKTLGKDSIDDAVKEFDMELYYKIEDGKLYLSNSEEFNKDNFIIYSLNGNVLNLNSYNTTYSELPPLELPVKFKKVG